MPATNQTYLIIGATGLVGGELLSILLINGIAKENIIATASKQSAGKTIDVGNTTFQLQVLCSNLFVYKPLVIQCASNDAALEWVPIAIKAGCTVIDCSSVFRQDVGVPLVIPCVNGALVESSSQLIVGPNCTTIILLTAIEGIRQAFDIRSITVATYQSISGAGRQGLQALAAESCADTPTTKSIFPEPCARNVFCHESSVSPTTGYNGEEEKVISEVHKIWDDSTVAVFPTCMRVPVVRVHTESITLTIAGKVTESEILQVLHDTKNITVFNKEGDFPTALKASGGDDVLVGHVRVVAYGDQTIVSLVACGDQIRTGAALNAFRIAQAIH